MKVRVRTTQNIFIDYPIASAGDRILSYLLDMLILVLYSIAMIVLYVNLDLTSTWIWMVSLGLPYLLYSVLFEIFMNGQTPGKRAMDIKVLRMDGSPAHVGDYLMRWIFGIVEIQLMSGLIALLTIAIGGKGQRLGDMAAGTTVVKLIAQRKATAAEVFVQQPDDYIPLFPQVIQLDERDIEIIQRALEANREDSNLQPVLVVTEKIKSMLGIQTDLPPLKFLYTIIKDFQHLTSR